MHKNNLALIGFMGSGKTVAAKRLGELLERPVISTDQLVEERAGSKISYIFERFGENYFRKIERDIITEVAKQNHVIIDCGGGVVIDPHNLTQLKKKSVVIYLSASAEVIYERVKQYTHRPLLQNKDPQKTIKELLTTRLPYYQKADYTIETDGKTNEQVCDEILESVNLKK